MMDETNKLSIAVSLLRVAVEHRRWAEVMLALTHAEERIAILRQLALEENRKDLLQGVPDLDNGG